MTSPLKLAVRLLQNRKLLFQLFPVSPILQVASDSWVTRHAYRHSFRREREKERRLFHYLVDRTRYQELQLSGCGNESQNAHKMHS